MLIDGQWRAGRQTVPVIDPYRGVQIGVAPESDAADLEDALAAAVRAKAEVARMPAYERAELLRRMARLVVERVEPVARLMVRETGKPIRDARIEVARCEGVLTLSAEEAIRIEGSQVPLDANATGNGKLAVTWRFPVGVVGAITPFNAPYNLAWHKIAPALAAGNAVVLKAPPQAALVVHELSKLLVDAGLPAGWVNILYGKSVGPALVADPRVDFITFTGSSAVGAQIKARSGLRRVALELGGTGPTIIHKDADLDLATPLCSTNSMRLAGQSCLSVQNLYVHESLYESFVPRFVAQVENLKVGDPAADDTDVGTLIDAGAAERVIGWIDEARSLGARVLTGGTRAGAQVRPTVIVDAQPGMCVVDEEIFGPVAVIHKYSDLDATLARIIGERLAEQVKQSVVVENREGAGGVIGTQFVAKARPDGYTLVMVSNGVTIVPYLYATPPFDVIKDFTPVGKLTYNPLVMVTSAGAPFKTFTEMLAWIKANPGRASYATSGKGAQSHLEAAQLMHVAGLTVPDVPYKSTAQALADTVSGTVSFYIAGLAPMTAQIKAGKLRALAVGGNRRAEALPDVPTMIEASNNPANDLVSWVGMLAPAGTPANVITKLYDELAKATDTPASREKIGGLSAGVALVNPQQTAAQLKAESEKWGALVKALNIKNE